MYDIYGTLEKYAYNWNKRYNSDTIPLAKNHVVAHLNELSIENYTAKIYQKELTSYLSASKCPVFFTSL